MWIAAEQTPPLRSHIPQSKSSSRMFAPKLLQTRTNWMQERVFSFLGFQTMFQEIKTKDLNCRSDDLSASSKCEGRRKHGHESNEPERILLEACNRGPKCSNDQPLINHHSGSGWLPLRVFQVYLGPITLFK